MKIPRLLLAALLAIVSMCLGIGLLSLTLPLGLLHVLFDQVEVVARRLTQWSHRLGLPR